MWMQGNLQYNQLQGRIQNFRLMSVDPNRQLGFSNQPRIFIWVVRVDVGFLCEVEPKFSLWIQKRTEVLRVQPPPIETLESALDQLVSPSKTSHLFEYIVNRIHKNKRKGSMCNLITKQFIKHVKRQDSKSWKLNPFHKRANEATKTKNPKS